MKKSKSKVGPVEKTLRKAKNIIQTDGWVRGEFARGGKCCAWGAINKAETGSADSICYNDALDLLGGVMSMAVGGEIPVATFNDFRAKSKADVLVMFNDAIRIARLLERG